MKLAILRWHPMWSQLWLVHSFWLRDSCIAWLVMTFVYECASVIHNSISIWCVSTQGHQDYRMTVSQSEVHATLQACALAAAHFQVRDNFVYHNSLSRELV